MKHYHVKHYDSADPYPVSFVENYIDLDDPCQYKLCTSDDMIYICPSPAMHFPARDNVVLDWEWDGV